MSNYGQPQTSALRPMPSQRFPLAPGQAPATLPSSLGPPHQGAPTSAAPAAAPSKSNTSSWFCDACELSLESHQALKSHRRSHVRCTECSFEGAPKVVKAHYQGTHGKFSGSGYKTVTVAVPGCRVQRFRICVGNRPEDIQRWIAERKKRFPRQKPTEKDSTTLRKSEGRENFGVMSTLLAGYGSSASEEENTDHKGGNEIERITGTPGDNVISTQSGHSGKTTDAQGQTAALSRVKRPCRYFMRNGSCLNGDACRFSHEISPHRWTMENETKKRKRGGHTTSDTLLRKLLANDMERESSLAMQLLEYIVDRDFFD